MSAGVVPAVNVFRAADIKDYAPLRRKMVELYVMPRGVGDPRVLAAMREVPRHLFVPSALASEAYGDHALPIGKGQTISQPFIVARMTELLHVAAESKVLEIGTGCGYQTAVLAQLARRVYSIERVHDLALRAQETIRSLGLSDKVSIKVFDGTYGWSEQGPFDRILVAAGAPEIPQPLVLQLAEGGRMLIPVGSGSTQRLMLAQKRRTRLSLQDCGEVSFVKLIGKFGWGS